MESRVLGDSPDVGGGPGSKESEGRGQLLKKVVEVQEKVCCGRGHEVMREDGW